MATPLKSCLKKGVKGQPVEKKHDPRQLQFHTTLTLITATGEAFSLELPQDEQTAPATDHVAIPIAEPDVAKAVLMSPPSASFMPAGDSPAPMERKFSAQKVKGTIGIRKTNQRRASLLDMNFTPPPVVAAAVAAGGGTGRAPGAPQAAAAAAPPAPESAPAPAVDPAAAAVADEAAVRRKTPKPPADDTLLEGFCTVKLLRKGADYVPSKIYIRGNGVVDTFLISATKEGLAPALRKAEADAGRGEEGKDEAKDDVVVEYVYDKSYQVLYATNPSIVSRLARLIAKSQELWTCADCVEVPCKPDASLLRTYLPPDASVKPVSMLFTFTSAEECRSFEQVLQPYCIVPPYSPGYLEDYQRQTAAPPVEVSSPPAPESSAPAAAAAVQPEPDTAEPGTAEPGTAEPYTAELVQAAPASPTSVTPTLCVSTVSTEDDAAPQAAQGMVPDPIAAERMPHPTPIAGPLPSAASAFADIAAGGRSPRGGRYPDGPAPELPSRGPDDGSRERSRERSVSKGRSDSTSSTGSSTSGIDEEVKPVDAAAQQRSIDILLGVGGPTQPPLSPRMKRKQQKEKEKDDKRKQKLEAKEAKRREKEQKKREAKESKKTKPKQYRKPGAFPGIPLRTESCASDILAARSPGRSPGHSPAVSPRQSPAASPAKEDAFTPAEEKAESASVAVEESVAMAQGSDPAAAAEAPGEAWSKTSQPEEVLSSLHDEQPADKKGSPRKLSNIPGVLKTRNLVK